MASGRSALALLAGSLLMVCLQARAAETAPEVRNTSFSVVPYGGYVDYMGSTTKRSASLGGCYGSLGYGLQNLVEAEADYADISRIGVPHLRQWDATLAYSNFTFTNWKLRAGGHYLTCNDSYTNDGWTAFVGADYYIPYSWDVGLDTYFSQYVHYRPRMSVNQVSPRFGRKVIQGETYTLRTDLKGYWIHLSDSNGGARRNYFSFEDRFTFYYSRWSLAGFGWAGRQAFAVRGEGFTVYNLPEEHHAGYGLELGCSLTSRLGLTFRSSRERYKEWGRNAYTHATSNLLMLGYRF